MKKFIIPLIIGIVVLAIGLGVILLLPTDGSSLPTVEGSGTSKNLTKDLSSIRSVDIDIPGEVQIENSDDSTLSIDADDNLMGCITVTDEDRKLFIEQKTCEGKMNYEMKPKAGIKIVIKSSTIERIAVGSSAKVNADAKESKEFDVLLSSNGSINANIATTKLTVRVAGPGSITLTGQAFEQLIDVTSSGSFDGRGLTGNVGTVTMTGSGDVLMNTSEVLTVKGAGSGSVSYIGAPSLTITTSGSTKIAPFKGN